MVFLSRLLCSDKACSICVGVLVFKLVFRLIQRSQDTCGVAKYVQALRDAAIFSFWMNVIECEGLPLHHCNQHTLHSSGKLGGQDLTERE